MKYLILIAILFTGMANASLPPTIPAALATGDDETKHAACAAANEFVAMHREGEYEVNGQRHRAKAGGQITKLLWYKSGFMGRFDRSKMTVDEVVEVTTICETLL